MVAAILAEAGQMSTLALGIRLREQFVAILHGMVRIASPAARECPP
jgi:hypothetical protein